MERELRQLETQLSRVQISGPIQASSHCQFTPGCRFGANDEYEVVRKLGDGRFASVWQVNTNKQPAAIKVYRMGRDNQRYYENEIKILNKIFTHSRNSVENLVSYFGLFIHVATGMDLAPVLHPCVIFELCGDTVSSLMKYCRHKYDSGLALPTVKKITVDVLTGLNYLHSIGVIHTDIKPSNLLLSTSIDAIAKGNNFKVKLADLGSATPADDLFSLHVGTDPYCAPEILLELNYGTSADIWAVFTTCYELITSMYLFDLDDECGVEWGSKKEAFDNEYIEESVDTPDKMEVDGGESSLGSDDSRDESSSGEDEDREKVTYMNLLLIEKILGRPPQYIIDNGRLYYNARGHLKNNPEITYITIGELLNLNCEIDGDEIARIEEFLLTGLRYLPDTRITASQALQHPWLRQ